MSTKLIAITCAVDGKSPEELIGYVARVSNPKNQDNIKTIPNLLKYCIRNKHWSIFETSSMTVQITCSRSICSQILRHRSFTFQEFSQRYSEVSESQFQMVKARRQASVNRQSSIDDLDSETIKRFNDLQELIWSTCKEAYDHSRSLGISREQSRNLLPLSTTTSLYMTGSVRSWIHYIELRSLEDTQEEHRMIVLEIKSIFKKEFPIISDTLGW